MEENNYKVVKLITGEDIICYISYESSEYIVMNKPYIVRQIPLSLNSNESHLSFSNWNPFSKDENFKVYNTQVITVSSCKNDIANFYLKISNNYDDDISFREEPSSASPDAEDDSDITEKYLDILNNFNKTKH